MQNSKILREFICETSKQTNVISEILRGLGSIPDRNTSKDTKLDVNIGASKDTEDSADIDASVLKEAIGWLYWWGKGTPNTPWADGRKGVDCTGFVMMALVKLGILPSSAIDRNSHGLAKSGKKIKIGDQRVGDIAYYTKGHAAIVIGPPGEDGHSPIMGTTGGGRHIKGNDPTSLVRTRDKAKYRDDFDGYYRISA